MAITEEELITRFTYHAPRENQNERYADIRGIAHHFADQIVKWTPESREQSLALTALEEVVFWASAAIARREGASVVEAAQNMGLLGKKPREEEGRPLSYIEGLQKIQEAFSSGFDDLRKFLRTLHRVP
jgi:hypothetical protein